MGAGTPGTEKPPYSLKSLLLYFLRLGAAGFGGPVALVGRMERDLVADHGWLSREEYVRGLALSQLAPGPLAAQLAMYIGYVRNGFIGATVVGLAFILPSIVMVVLLGMLYVQYGGLPWMQSLFYGIGAAVIGIIVKSAYRLAKVTLKSEKLLWLIFLAMGTVTAITEHEFVWLFVLSGFLALVVLSPPGRFRGRAQMMAMPVFGFLLQAPVLLGGTSFVDLVLYFAKAGSFVFGSGLAIVPFLHGTVVQQFHWLNERQFLDAVAVAMITPGPVVITVGFIGYLVGGLWGAIASALGVFIPVYLVVVIVTPFYERIAANPQVNAFIQGVTSAATGAIAGAVVVLGRRAITDVPTAAIAIGTLGILVKFKVPEPIVVIVAGLVGLLTFQLQ